MFFFGTFVADGLIFTASGAMSKFLAVKISQRAWDENTDGYLTYPN